MKKFTKYMVAASIMCAATGASAQTLKSGYFLDNYLFKHQMNPAMSSESNYVSIPVIGNINVGTHGNVGLGKFLYPYNNGGLTTFLNSSISANDFLGSLKSNNKMGASINIGILSAGFKAWGGFNTIDIGLRSNTTMNMPYELFEFLKIGQQGASSIYDMTDMGVNSSTYIELAFGHSREINENLRVGAKVKFLLGGAYADMKMTDMKVTLSEDKWMIQANGEMNAALKGLVLPTKQESGKEVSDPSQNTLIDFGEMDIDSPGLSGFGLAVDLGATYKVMDNLTVSAAIKDLGFINWSNNIYGKTANEAWEFNGFQNIATGDNDTADNPNSFDNQLEALGDDLENFSSFHRESTGGSLSRALSATLNIGAEYALPMYDKLSFGILSSTRFNGPYTYAEGRISANVSPLNWLEGGVNYCLSNYGSSMGWIVNIQPKKGVGVFIGMDQLIGKVSKQFIPINNMNSNFSFGLNVTF